MCVCVCVCVCSPRVFGVSSLVHVSSRSRLTRVDEEEEEESEEEANKLYECAPSIHPRAIQRFHVCVCVCAVRSGLTRPQWCCLSRPPPLPTHNPHKRHRQPPHREGEQTSLK